MDDRIKLLSYSSLTTLHKCPRKFQLYRLNSEAEEGTPEAAKSQNVTFAYGHIVGDGIQKVFEGWDLDAIIFRMFLDWHAELFDSNDKQNKSFWTAVAAVQKFHWMRENNGYLEDWELLYHEGKPAVELSFRITFPDGFKMRGSVDAVLRHKETGEVMVLECKTSSFNNIASALFKNSAQGIGYSVVLDVICPSISSYQVLYLVYKTKTAEFEQLSFPKSYLQRALWIQELLLDIEIIKLYDKTGVYPMHGESCYDFYRECEYMNLCTLSTKVLTKPLKDIDEEGNVIPLDPKVYDVELTLVDLLSAQLDRNTVKVEEEIAAELAVDSSQLPDDGDIML